MNALAHYRDIENNEEVNVKVSAYPPYKSAKFGFTLDGNLVQNLSYFRKSVLSADWDCVFIVDGREGAGKSTIAGQIAEYLDREHNIDLATQVAFTPDDFINKALALPKGKAIIYDESRTGLNRRRSLSQANFHMTNFLAECRQKNLFIVIVLPYFHDLDVYLALSRTFFLVNTRVVLNTTTGLLERGFYNFFSVERVKKMFCDEKYRRYRAYMKPNFGGRFVGKYAWEPNEYRQMKRDALTKYEPVVEKMEEEEEKLPIQEPERSFDIDSVTVRVLR